MQKLFFYVSAFLASSVIALSTGCLSGGFKLTRQYARWVNSQMIILRIVLYIVTLPIYAVTLVVDAVLFNTMDFWNGTVAAGAYKFDHEDKTYFVNHGFQPGTQLKKTQVQIKDKSLALLQTMDLLETPSGEIEMYIDGKLRTKVTDVNSFPIASVFNAQGEKISEEGVLTSMPLANAQVLARY